MQRVRAVFFSMGACLASGAAWAAAPPIDDSRAARPEPPKATSLEEPPPGDKTHHYASFESVRTFRPNPDQFSLTFSPFHLLLPMFRVGAELKLIPHLGVAVFGGIGWLELEETRSDGSKGSYSAAAYLAGGQLIGYPARRFDGIAAGAQVQYVRVDAQGKVDETSVAGAASGFAVGPFLGYKWITQIGFTVSLQGGVQYLAIRAHGTNADGGRGAAKDSRVAPIANADIGWSF